MCLSNIFVVIAVFENTKQVVGFALYLVSDPKCLCTQLSFLSDISFLRGIQMSLTFGFSLGDEELNRMLSFATKSHG